MKKHLNNVSLFNVSLFIALSLMTGAIAFSANCHSAEPSSTVAAKTVNPKTVTAKSTTQSTEVPWLKEVQAVPAKLPDFKIGHQDPLLKTEEGTSITTLEQWKIKRRVLRKKWRNFLGPMPDNKAISCKYKVLHSEIVGRCVRQLIEYEGEQGDSTEAYLLFPVGLKKEDRCAAVIVPHPTTSETIRSPAGLAGKTSRQQGIQLCQKGFIVICPKCFLWHKAKNFKEAVANFQKKHPKTLGMAKMLFDTQRGIDILEHVANVDKTRIGVFGHSLGAKEAFYLAAFDDRIQVTVASEGGIGLYSTNWDAPWYLGKAIHDDSFRRNHHELLALAAPKPVLILGGEKGNHAVDGDRSWHLIQPAMEVYQLYPEPARLAFYNHKQGHDVPPKVNARGQEWLSHYLQVRRRTSCKPPCKPPARRSSKNSR